MFQVLLRMGFSKGWRKWIKACISRAWFLVIVNGKVVVFFSSTQGVRQGDPLSPALFIIMAEAFSRTINHQHVIGKWKGATIAGTNISVTHSLFVDDNFLFGASNIQEAHQIKSSLHLYSIVSGQAINEKKSKVYIFNTNKVISDKIVKILGFTMDFLPSKYLEIPFFMGTKKSSYWSSVVQRIQSRIAAWKTRWLSLADRILLIKSVLSTIPNDFLAVLKAPIKFLQHIQKLIRSFLWTGNMNDVKKIPLISLQEMANFQAAGGVGIHDLAKRNEAFGRNLVWKMYQKPQSTWCKIM